MRRLRILAQGMLTLAAAAMFSFTAMAGGFKGEVKGKENPVSISRQVKEKEAVLVPGSDVRSALVELAGSARYIRSVRFTETEPDFSKVVYYKNLSESGAPVYAWCPEEETTAICLYSGAETVYLNPDSSGMFSSMSNLADISGLEKLNASRAVNLDGMFQSCAGIVDLGSIRNWDVSGVTNFDGLFYGISADSLEALKDWKVSAGESFVMTFAHCSDLVTLSGLEMWDMGQTKNMADMFTFCRSLDNVDALADWDVSQAEDMAELFAGCEMLASIDGLADWVVSSCQFFVGTSGICHGMFYNCKKLTEVDGLLHWDVSKGTSFRGMFEGCESLESLWGLKDWKVGGSGSFYQMFHRCYSIVSLEPLQGWDVSGADTVRDMFRDCTSLVSLAGMENWDVSGVTNFNSTFSGCTGLKEIGALADWDISSGTMMRSMFYECTSITEIAALKDWNPASCCEDISYLFLGTGITDGSMLSRHSAVRNGVSYMAWDIDTAVTEVKGAFNETNITSADKYPDWYPSYAAAAFSLNINEGSIPEEVWDLQEIGKATESNARRATASNVERIDGLETERVIEWEIIINGQEEIEEDGLPDMKRATESNAERVEE